LKIAKSAAKLFKVIENCKLIEKRIGFIYDCGSEGKR
jgi:hypothetical protein